MELGSRTMVPRFSRRSGRAGFTLIEVLIVTTIIGILATLSVVGYTDLIERARVVQAIGDVRAIECAIDDYYYQHGTYPASLAAVGMDDRLDPWGNRYAYAVIPVNGKGAVRKDKNLVPINTDYDLYSKGADGSSVPPLTAKASRDDIVRANNGGFVGLASNY